ncbi:hypothetical protein ACVDG8_034505 [Mesorhizobium sp. ORM8.1]
MWEVLMMLRLIASVSPKLSPGHGRHALPPTMPVETLQGAIRLSFAAWRLSLPLPKRPDGQGNHDRKIA